MSLSVDSFAVAVLLQLLFVPASSGPVDLSDPHNGRANHAGPVLTDFSPHASHTAAVRREGTPWTDDASLLERTAAHAEAGLWASGLGQAGAEPSEQQKPLDRSAAQQERAKPALQQQAKEIGATPVPVPLMSYPIAASLVGAAITFLYGSRGMTVVFTILCYLGCLSSMKLTVKWVFVHNGFAFAKLISATHFLSGALACFGVLVYRRRHGRPMPYPTTNEFLFMMVPVSLAVVMSIGANNMALVFSTAAFTEIIGSTNCLVTVVMVWVLGLPFDWKLLFPTMIVAAGCAISTAGEINFSLVGMLLCFTSNIFRSVKVTLQQKLLTGDSRAKFDPCALLFWISLPCFAVMMAASFATEGLAPYRQVAALDRGQLWSLIVAVLISCLNATALNLSQLFVTKDLGAVGSQLVAQCKCVLTVLGGMTIFGETFTALEAIGFVQVLFGVYLFGRIEQGGKKENASKAETTFLSNPVKAPKASAASFQSYNAVQPPLKASPSQSS